MRSTKSINKQTLYHFQKFHISHSFSRLESARARLVEVSTLVSRLYLVEIREALDITLLHELRRPLMQPRSSEIKYLRFLLF